MLAQDSKPSVALTTGVTGQDGAYLAEYLLGPGYGAWYQAPVVIFQRRAH
jgi:GDP-D-mannose dehydratase